MMQSILDYKAEKLANQDLDYQNLEDFGHLLSQVGDTLQSDIIEHISQKEEQSRRDLQLSHKVSMSEQALIGGSTKRIIDQITPIDSYKKDMLRLKSILSECSTIHSDTYQKTTSGLFASAIKKLNRQSNANAEFLNILMLFAGDSKFISDKYKIIHDSYDKALVFLITEPEIYIPDYCDIILKTIKRFSKKLEVDEFYTIYMDMINHTATDYLGSDIVNIINTYSRYTYVTDKESAFDKYLAISIE